VHAKMVVLRCTRQLLMRLKYPGEDTSPQSSTRLGDWYGTLIRLGRRHVLLFISERSRLPVLLPVRHADRLAVAFPRAVSGMLMGLGVPAAATEQEGSSMSQIILGPGACRFHYEPRLDARHRRARACGSAVDSAVQG
jgi:hypothetical protein